MVTVPTFPIAPAVEAYYLLRMKLDAAIKSGDFVHVPFRVVEHTGEGYLLTIPPDGDIE